MPCNHNSACAATYIFHTSRWGCWWLLISTYGPAAAGTARAAHVTVCLKTSADPPACNPAYMRCERPTYWKEGGRESPMPPVLSRGGGSSGWLSVHWDPPSECALSARTSWEGAGENKALMRVILIRRSLVTEITTIRQFDGTTAVLYVMLRNKNRKCFVTLVSKKHGFYIAVLPSNEWCSMSYPFIRARIVKAAADTMLRLAVAGNDDYSNARGRFCLK